MTDDKQQKLNCNFCGKHREEVEKLIAGPNVYICDECIKISYDIVKDEAHLDRLLATEPMWELFEHEEVVEKLFHINNHYDIVKQHLPTSVEQLAMILALIRPGKRYLVGKSWEEIEASGWTKTQNDTYFFKKSHSYSYAVAIIVQLNLLCEG